MQQNAPQTNADPADVFVKRRRTALWCSVSLFGLSVLVLVVGLLSATHTDNVAVSGYYPGIILSFGAFLGVVGLNLVENRRPMLVASIIFISLGVVSCFLCSIIDGIIAAEFIDRRPLMEGRCEFYSSSSYSYDSYYTEVHCNSYGNPCKLKVKTNTCYCCDLYHCDSVDYSGHYYAFTGVSSCWDVVNLYRLMWACVTLNILGVFLGIITAAVLGAFKDLAPVAHSHMTPSPAPPPHILYNPSQHMISYTGFCPSGQTLPAYPNYSLPMQHLNGYPAPSAAPPTPEVSNSPSNETPPATQSGTNPTGPTQTQSQDTSAYMLTPNAPSLYAHSLGPFEKPPPYAC
ncbi:transmembrane protein 255B [Pimephales promelas]|uniref:transmembrane protein 255B n=1 Tax=Pimephales promelas TaxID=90988 RepID=UPI001955C314|nr:transmembrane protein 255B [Pimephales promelas]KAG1939268.1 transmembrane protein 255B [Pimephales promelas]